MVEIDWHIKCDKNEKKCIIYSDKDEEHPVIELNTVTKKYKDFNYGQVHLKNMVTFNTLSVEGTDKQSINSNEVIISTGRR